MNRPAGATFIAVCLGSVGIEQLSRFRDQTFWPLTLPGNVLNLAALATALVGGAAAVGIWRLQPWAFKAVVAFSVLMLSVTAYGGAVVGPGGFLEVSNLLLVQGIFFALIARYVHWVVRSRPGVLPDRVG